MQHNKFNWRY